MATHLCVRSAYSLLQGTMSIEKMVRKAKELGYTSLAITDRLSMHGIPEFYAQCTKQGIHPVIGVELDIAMGDTLSPFVVLARDDEGYRCLLKLSTQAKTSDEPISTEQLFAAQDHLFLICFAEGGLFEEALIKEDIEKINTIARQLKEALPTCIVGCSYEESAFWKARNQLLRTCLKKLHIDSVALNKVFYAEQDDDTAYRILIAIGRQQTISDKGLPQFPNRNMLSLERMAELYPTDELKLSDVIAEACHVSMKLERTFLPKFETPNGVDAKQYLTQLCLQGLKKRFNTNTPGNEYVQRLKFELDVITDMHFEDYFLIVWDFIRFARRQEIYVGPGRGSAAGSLVAYVLGITHVDPLKFQLLFERFLNPARISMPDIDIDFPDNRRDEVINYVLQKYGAEHVAHIATFGTLAAKQALRDVGRVLEISVRDLDMISKTIPTTLKITLPKARAESTRFNQLLQSDPRFEQLYTYASALEGLPRHVSTHAAGIVLSDTPLSDTVPLIKVESDMLSTQFTMEYLERLGLIKMDFLGLRNLTIIDETVSMIKVAEGKTIDILHLPLDDEATFKLIRKVDMVGVFQLESDGMKNLIRRMQPDKFGDIVATIALFRPGPMENIPEYLSRRTNPQSVVYIHEDLKEILSDTYGIMIYQEQIMQTAQKMAGFTLAKADLLRKAMSKKNAVELKKMQTEFIEGCKAKGHTEAMAIELFNLIQKFANYGFNKSHSVAYAMISYQMAYLKANYPSKFFAALLSSVIGSEAKTAEYIDECRNHGVQLNPPSVNQSNDRYQLQDDSIRFPLLIIKGVGGAACREILIERQTGGLFTDYYDFVARIMTHRFNRKNIESLIDAGALDEFAMSRKTMLASLDDACTYADLVRIDTLGQSRIDLGLVSRPIPIVVSDKASERAEREKEVLGFYLSSHPLITYKKANGITHPPLITLKPSGNTVKFLAVVQRVKQYRTKTGQMMAFVSVNDESSSIDLVVMPNLFEKYADSLIKGAIVEIEGKIDKEASCLVKSITVRQNES